MRRGASLALAVALTVLVVTAALPSPQAQGVNRPPNAILGPDQVVDDSKDPCEPNDVLQGCTRIDFDFSQSWDPDPRDSLARVDSYDIAIQSTSPNSPECIFLADDPQEEMFVPVRDGPGRFYTYAPVITSPYISQCVITVRVIINDGHDDDPQPNYCCTTATIHVTVKNGNEPPAFDCDERDRCTRTALSVATPTGRDRVDLLRDRGGMITFSALRVTDDRSATSMEVYLDQVNELEEVTHRLIVPMHKCGPASMGVGYSDPACPWSLDDVDGQEGPQPPVDQPCCQRGNPIQHEISSWRGTLAVNTRELIAGSYTVWARVSDADGQRDLYPKERLRLEVEGEGALCGPPCIYLNKPVYLVPGLDAAKKLTAGPCFPDGEPNAEREFFVLGHGETLRPTIQGPYPSDDDTDPITRQPYQLADPNLLLWKVTLQVCSVVNGVVAKQPPIPLDPPYFVSLDTLFRGDEVDQEVQLVAYDRIGGRTTKTINLITDLGKPHYLVDVPSVTYQDIPFRLNVLVQDRILTELALHIDGFEAGTGLTHRATASLTPFEQDVAIRRVPVPACATSATPTCVVGELSMTLVPPLRGATEVDASGKQDGRQPCSYAYDSDGDGRPDSVFDGIQMKTVGKLLERRSTKGPWNDFVVDLDGDGTVDAKEPVLPGTASGTPEAGRCDSPFESPAVLHFLRARETQVFAFNLTRHELGPATYRLTIRDVVFNNFAAANHLFRYPAGCAGPACREAESFLIGRFDTARALIDAQVVGVEVVPGPYLPGDAIWVNVTVRQESRQWPPPRAWMALGIDEKPRVECLVEWHRAIRATPWVNRTSFPDDLQAVFTALYPTVDMDIVPDIREVTPACLVPANTAECLPAAAANATLPPLQQVRAKCVSVFPRTYSDLNKQILFQLGAPPERFLAECEQPDDVANETTVCFQRPDRAKGDHQLQLPFPPGTHVVAAYVELAAQYNDTEEYDALASGGKPNNYGESESFEVFLGRVVSGSADASGHAKGKGKEYHIRADCPEPLPLSLQTCRGTPRLRSGAVEVGADGRMRSSCDLEPVHEPTLRYRLLGAGCEGLYWDPAARLDVDPTLCGLPKESTQPCKRPITVVAPATATTTTDKASPAPGLLAALVLLGIAAWAGRRRDL